MANEDAIESPDAGGGYLDLTGDLSVSLVLVLPLLFVYQLGVLLIDFEVLNGVDLLTRYVVWIHGPKGIVLLNLLVLAAFFAATIRLGHRGRFRSGLFVPLVLESALYAWLLGSLVIVVVERLSLLSLVFDHATGFVLSIGAGVYEELVFRLILIAVIEFILGDMLELKGRAPLIGAVVLSSVLFSLAHHVGPFGEPLRVPVFLFRVAAGLIFAAIYKLRSFAVAVYTHAIYDLYVFFL